ncbi:MAG TPA: hypothetical protein VK358_17295 [Longimicrobium sp.]|nr:hypothetical protein [Longimicrobium sp.]
MRPHLRLALLAALAILAPAAAAQAVPDSLGTEPPSILIIVPPLTAFPDPVAISIGANLPHNLTVEAGVAALLPGVFARAGLALPVNRDQGEGTDLLAYGGYRVIALPLMDALQGPTAGFGMRRWKRNGWGFQLNAGLWLTDAKVDCVGDCPLGPDNRIILPEVRFAAIRAR